jgi:hypothetical protein
MIAMIYIALLFVYLLLYVKMSTNKKLMHIAILFVDFLLFVHRLQAHNS